MAALAEQDATALTPSVPQGAPAQGRFVTAALERHKREGMELSIKARLVALAVVAVLLLYLNFSVEMLYYHVLLLLLAVIGLLKQRYGKVGQSRAELFLLVADLVVLTVALALPNPFSSAEWPYPMQFRFENFVYYYVILAAGTLSYSWRTVMAIGNLTALLWLGAVAGIWIAGRTDPALSQAVAGALPDPGMAEILDPNAINFPIRVQEVVVFLIVSYTLAVTVRRNGKLVLEQAQLERERANLARYFSPNVVDDLSHNDEPLKQVRSQSVAVMFVDIVGFTTYAAQRPGEEVIRTLRSFHERMEAEVFRHDGTLDKYLGDGLMATFGTPFSGPRDATNALACGLAMQDAIAALNVERRAVAQPEIDARIGLHYGPVVLGDIGANRLEFAVVGNTVNVASRIEALTRSLGAKIAISDALLAQVMAEATASVTLLERFQPRAGQRIRGVEDSLTLWTLD